MSLPRPSVGYVLPAPDYPAHRKMAKHLPAITPEVRGRSLAKFFHALQRSYGYYYSTPGYAPKAAARAADDVRLAGLARRGVAAARLPEAVKDRVRQALEPLVDELSAGIESKEVGARKFRDLNRRVDPAAFPVVFELFGQWLDESGIMAMFSAYSGAPLKMGSLFVQKNDAETSKHRYGVISEDGLPASRLGYMHIDSAVWPTVKILIYMTDVDIDGGPFRICVGTQALPSLFEFLVRKTNDGLKLPAEEFLALPDEFRQHALFGDYVDSSDAAAADLLAREWPVLSTDGDVICFDNNAVHRGGFVRKGHRLMLQLNFDPA